VPVFFLLSICGVIKVDGKSILDVIKEELIKSKTKSKEQSDG
jgi:hypothetical protein